MTNKTCVTNWAYFPHKRTETRYLMRNADLAFIYISESVTFPTCAGCCLLWTALSIIQLYTVGTLVLEYVLEYLVAPRYSRHQDEKFTTYRDSITCVHKTPLFLVGTLHFSPREFMGEDCLLLLKKTCLRELALSIPGSASHAGANQYYFKRRIVYWLERFLAPRRGYWLQN